MPLTRLVVHDFRNLREIELAPAGKLNFVQGENGTGKTSLLEAISTLAIGRSFRTRKFRNLIHLECSSFTIFAELQQLGAVSRLGVSRSRAGESQFRLDDRPVSSAVELAELLPFQIIDAQSFLLLQGGPSERRRFLDWMVFHVKHSYPRLWGEYVRCLKQRNSLLRSGKITNFEMKTWDATLSKLADQIDAARAEVVDVYVPLLQRFLAECGFIARGRFSIEYQRGWNEGHTLEQELQQLRAKEERQGFTSVGPHKADIKLRIDKKDAAEVFSRGQQKSVVIAMYMAQLNLFHEQNGSDCILLVDDLPAELDRTNQDITCRWLAALDKVQIFITGIDLQPIIQTWPKAASLQAAKMFHVKHGQVTEQSIGATHDR